MPKQAASIEQIRPRLDSVALSMGCQIVDVELVKEATGRFLRIYADKEGGITLDDLEKAHKKLQPLVENIDYDFMEVSSPGVDRPLKTPEDFARHEGDEVEIHLYKPVNGSKIIRGFLIGLKDNKILLKTSEDSEDTEEFERKSVALVKPVFEFDEADLPDMDEEEIDPEDRDTDEETTERR